MFPYSSTTTGCIYLEINFLNTINRKEQELRDLNYQKNDAIRRSPIKRPYLYHYYPGLESINFEDVRKSELQIATIQSKINLAEEEIKNYKRRYDEFRLANRAYEIKSQSEKRDDLEYRIKAMEIERKIKEKEGEQLREIEILRAKYGASILDVENRMNLYKIQLDNASKSLDARKTFYEKEIAELSLTEKHLRESLIDLWQRYGVKGLPSYEKELEQKREEVAILKKNYENKLITLNLEKIDTSNEKNYIKDQIDQAERNLMYYEDKRRQEMYQSPRKSALHFMIEKELEHVNKLRNDLIQSQLKGLKERELIDKYRGQLTSNDFYKYSDLKTEMDLFKTKCENLSSLVKHYKDMCDKYFLSSSYADFQLYQSELEGQKIDINNLRMELESLKTKYQNLGYPTYSNLYEISKFENELLERQIEINNYLQEKVKLKEKLGYINIQDQFSESQILKPEFVSVNKYYSPSKNPYLTIDYNPNLPPSYSDKSSYILSSAQPSDNSQLFTQVNNDVQSKIEEKSEVQATSQSKIEKEKIDEPITMEFLEYFYQKKSEKWKLIIEEKDPEKIIEEIKTYEENLKELSEVIEEKIKKINMYKEHKWTDRREYQKLKEENERLIFIFNNAQNECESLKNLLNPSQVSEEKQFVPSDSIPINEDQNFQDPNSEIKLDQEYVPTGNEDENHANDSQLKNEENYPINLNPDNQQDSKISGSEPYSLEENNENSQKPKENEGEEKNAENVENQQLDVNI